MKKKIYDGIGETLYSETLPNSLTVLVIPKPGYARSHAMFYTNYGGADRRFRLDGAWQDTPEGVAHFLEHKMFDMPDGSNALAAFSARGADINAYTSAGLTAYFFDCTDGFEQNLRELLAFVSTPYYTQESVAKEQGIIGQEIRMSGDVPASAAYQELMRLLYEHHPIRDEIVGTEESIARITADTLYTCHRAFYRPSNMALCCVGNVDPEAVARIARQALPEEPSVPPERDHGPAESCLPARLYAEKNMAVSAPIFYIGAAVPPAEYGPVRLRQQLVGELATLCLAGESAPLSNALYADGRINRRLSSGCSAAAGTFTALIAGEGREPRAVLEALNREVEKVSADGFDLGLFNRVKKAYYGAELQGLGRFNALARVLAEGHFSGWCPLDVFEMLDTVTAEECAAFAARHLAPDRLVLSVVQPQD